MRRRDLLIAGLAIGALGVGEALRPRRRLKLLKSGTIAAAMPERFGAWEAYGSDLVNPAQAGRLARSLYSETVSRTYVHAATGVEVMVLAAYGDTQSDLLQLHRPESCYPAVGFALRSAKSVELRIAERVFLPAREVVATLEDRVENIAYWTRMGEMLPRTGSEQRHARLSNAVHGVIPDGILVRCSVVGETAASFLELNRFIPELLTAVANDKLLVFIGTKLAKSLI